jgi:predicted transcriptional regulator
VFSLRPEFAEAIYRGRKRFEFRRVRVRVLPGTLALIYEVMPVGLVTGCFSIGQVVSDTAVVVADLEQDDDLRQRTLAYLKGASVATALEVVTPCRLAVPTELSDVSGIRRAPQSYSFIRR